MILLTLLAVAPLHVTPALALARTAALPAAGEERVPGHDAEIALARRIGVVLEADRLALATLTDALGLRAHPGSDVGFGARVHRFRLSRGAGELELEVLTGIDEDGGRVVARARLHFRPRRGADEERSGAFLAAVRPAWPGTTGEDSDGPVLLAHWKDLSVLVELEREKQRALGPMPPVDVPASLRGDLEVLTSGFYQLTFGGACGIAGIPPRGRPEADRLLRAGRFDLFRVALRGWDPVGRAYAAEALLTHDRADILDHAAIRALRDQLIPVCDGCVGWTRTVGEVLAERLNR